MSWRTIQMMQGLGQAIGNARYQSRRMKMQQEQADLQSKLGSQQLQEAQDLAPLRKQRMQQQVQDEGLKGDVSLLLAGGGGEGDIARAGRAPRPTQSFQHGWVPEGRYNQNLGPTQPMPKVVGQSAGDQFDPMNKDPLANRYVGKQLLVQKPSGYDQQLTGLEIPPSVPQGGASLSNLPTPGRPATYQDRVNYRPTPQGGAKIGDSGIGLTQEQLPGSVNAFNPQMDLEKMAESRRQRGLTEGLKERGMKTAEGQLGLATSAQGNQVTQHDTANKLGVLRSQVATTMKQLDASLKAEDQAGTSAALGALQKLHAQMSSIAGLPAQPEAAPQGPNPDKISQLVDAALNDESVWAKVPPKMEDAVVQELVKRGASEAEARNMIGNAGGGKAGQAAQADEKAKLMQEAIKGANWRLKSPRDKYKELYETPSTENSIWSLF